MNSFCTKGPAAGPQIILRHMANYNTMWKFTCLHEVVFHVLKQHLQDIYCYHLSTQAIGVVQLLFKLSIFKNTFYLA